MGQRPWSAKETTSQLQAIINAHNNLSLEVTELRNKLKTVVIVASVVYAATLGFLLL